MPSKVNLLNNNIDIIILARNFKYYFRIKYIDVK